MNRAKTVLHMYVTIDGKIVIDLPHFPDGPETNAAGTIYDDLCFSEAKAMGCGRTTYYTGEDPDLTPYDGKEPIGKESIPEEYEYLCFCFDRKGRVAWDDAINPYAGRKAKIVEVITEKTDRRYLSYLEDRGIHYLFGGKDDIDPVLFLEKLKGYGIDLFYLCGGPEINSAFIRAGVADKLSLIVTPGVQGGRKELTFCGSDDLTGFPSYYKVEKVEVLEGNTVHLVYTK